jgi:hypothetical protein
MTETPAMRFTWKILAGFLLALPLATRSAESQPGPTPVLDLACGSFNVYLRWKTPLLVDKDGQIKPLLEPARKGLKEEERKPWPVFAAALPPENWTGADFDDSVWPRVRGKVMVGQDWGGGGLSSVAGYGGIHFPGNPAEWSLMCLRGKFLVTDPQQVKELKITVNYHGGAVVYVNGAELQRGHLPAGKISPDTLAERYGDDAYLMASGLLHSPYAVESPEVMKARSRSLPFQDAPDGTLIPGSMLRKGINVIAVELHTAPISEVDLTGKTGTVKGLSDRGKASVWPHVAVWEARVTAASNAGLVPCVGPSQSIELWNSQPLASVEAGDFARPSEKIAPIRLIGARNGTFSGKVVLSSAGAIRNLKATISDLSLTGPAGAPQAGAKGKIPATAVRVRLAEAAKPSASWVSAHRFDALLELFPAEIPAVQVKVRERKIQAVATAVAPVWVTVRVPADATPGVYQGLLNIEAQGIAPVAFRVPVEIKVNDWKIPDATAFDVYNNLYQSPDTVAQYYRVPLWSDRHLELVGKSLELFRQVGSRICVLNLTAKAPSLNNVDSMVVWVKKAGAEQTDGYDYDFSAVDKYMDVFAKIVGKPAILQLNVWSHPGMNPKEPYAPLSVTVRDPVTDQTSLMPQPAYGTPENEAFWKPVLTELRQRIEKRGWFDVTAVCNISYCRGPAKEVVDVFKNIWPDGKWMQTSHANPDSYPATSGSMPVAYSEWVWGAGRLYNPETDKGGKYQYAHYPRPWQEGLKRIEVGNPRYGNSFVERMADWSPLVLLRTVDEAATQAGVRGTGRVGGDFWPLPTGSAGRLMHLCDSYEAVGPANNTCSMTAPGPDGAVFTERLEMFREGLQVAEAITALTKALAGGKLPGALATEITRTLDERARYYLRARWSFGPRYTFGGDAFLSFESSDWQARDDRLFALAADATKQP